MGQKSGATLRTRTIDEIDRHGPGITLDKLIEQLDADPEEIVNIVEELQHYGDVDQEIILWRGGHSSASSA